MISLRSFSSSFTTLAVAAIALIGCGRDIDAPVAPNGVTPGSANLDGRPGDVGNSAKQGSIATRVLVDASGNATLEIRTGTYDDATNSPATPPASAGYFQKIQYKILDANSKQVAVENVNFKTDGVNVYTTPVDLCSTGKGDAGDTDGDKDDQACTTKWGAGWTVLVQANLNGVGGDGSKTDVVRDQQPGVSLPDVDIQSQQVWKGLGGNRTATLSVVSGAATMFSVDFPNTKSINGQPPVVGANMMCAVFVDGAQQTPGNANAFAYSGPQNIAIAPGQTVPCVFTLTLGFGSHTVHVTAMPLYPGDYDPANNTTADFTILSAPATGDPDVSAGLTQADTGSGAPHNLTLLSLRAQEPITLYQYTTLLGGQAPTGPVTCTLTIVNTGTSATQTISGTATVSPGAPSDACKIPYTFAAAGTYSITPVISLPAGGTDANAANNTGSTITITVAPPIPEATVTADAISFTDAAESITNQQIGLVSAADTVHSGDVATYAARLTVSSLLNTSSVNTISCKVFIDGVDKTSTASWVSGPTLSNVAAGSAMCSINQAFVETDNALHPHTVAFSISTGIKNDAPVANTSISGTINDIRRADVQGSSLLVLVNGQPASLDTVATIKQGATVTVQAPFTNGNTTIGTSLTCGSLLVNHSAITSLTAPAVDTAADAFTQTQTTGTVSIGAGGTSVCSYTVVLPSNLAVGAIPLALIGTPTASSPGDPIVSNNVAAGVLTVKSNGAFTDVKATDAVITQEWLTTSGSLSSSPFSELTGQGAEVDQLALLVVPNNADLGSFTLTGTVMSNGTTYGTGTYSTEVFESDNGKTCYRSAQTGLVPSAALDPNLRYSVAICSAPATSQPGFQVITVDYTQSLAGSIFNASYPLFSGTAQFKIVLNYHLALGNVTDGVSALVTVPIPLPHFAGGQWSNDTQVSLPQVQSPAP